MNKEIKVKDIDKIIKGVREEIKKANTTESSDFLEISDECIEAVKEYGKNKF